MQPLCFNCSDVILHLFSEVMAPNFQRVHSRWQFGEMARCGRTAMWRFVTQFGGAPDSPNLLLSSHIAHMANLI